MDRYVEPLQMFLLFFVNIDLFLAVVLNHVKNMIPKCPIFPVIFPFISIVNVGTVYIDKITKIYIML